MGDTDINTIVVAIGTIVLALVTFWYAYSTHKILKEQRKARKEEIQPKLWARLDFYTPVHCCLRIENIGRGPATDIDAEYSVVPDGGTRKWHYPLLSPKEYFRFFLPVPDKDTNSKILLDKYNEVIVKFSYSDFYREKHSDKAVIDLKKFKEGIEKGEVMYEKPIIDHIKEIKECVCEISKNVISLSSKIK